MIQKFIESKSTEISVYGKFSFSYFEFPVENFKSVQKIHFKSHVRFL